MIDANRFFTALSNEIRLRCIILMQVQGELCVCELTYAFGLSQPMISRHLSVLKDAGVVIDRREGQWIYYKINPNLMSWEKSVLKTTSKANVENHPFRDDQGTLLDMPNRPNSTCCA